MHNGAHTGEAVDCLLGVAFSIIQTVVISRLVTSEMFVRSTPNERSHAERMGHKIFILLKKSLKNKTTNIKSVEQTRIPFIHDSHNV